MSRAKELFEESVELLEKSSYKSANNRAFYAMEKSIKALLTMEQIEVTTHNGGLKQFNYAFIYKGDGTFKPEDIDLRIADMVALHIIKVLLVLYRGVSERVFYQMRENAKSMCWNVLRQINQ